MEPAGPATRRDRASRRIFCGAGGSCNSPRPFQKAPCRARGIPIEFPHCPTPPKPGRKASEGEQQAWRRAKRESKITTLAAGRLKELRAALDEDPSGKERVLVACGDGGYTNTRVMKNRPPRATLIGGIRKDAKLHALPPDPPAGGRGRRRLYGAPMPAPEQIRQDPEIPWRPIPT